MAWSTVSRRRSAHAHGFPLRPLWFDAGLALFFIIVLLAFVAMAQALVVITSGIDLSVGAIMVLYSVVMGQFAFRYGIPVPIALLCGLGCGALCGFINGWLIAYAEVPSLFTTLAGFRDGHITVLRVDPGSVPSVREALYRSTAGNVASNVPIAVYQGAQDVLVGPATTAAYLFRACAVGDHVSAATDVMLPGPPP